MVLLQLMLNLIYQKFWCTPSGSTGRRGSSNSSSIPCRAPPSTTEWTRCILDKNHGGILTTTFRLFAPDRITPPTHNTGAALRVRGDWRRFAGSAGLLPDRRAGNRAVDKSNAAAPGRRPVTSHPTQKVYRRVLVRLSRNRRRAMRLAPTDGVQRVRLPRYSQRRSPFGSLATASADPVLCSPAWKSVRQPRARTLGYVDPALKSRLPRALSGRGSGHQPGLQGYRPSQGLPGQHTQRLHRGHARVADYEAIVLADDVSR